MSICEDSQFEPIVARPHMRVIIAGSRSLAGQPHLVGKAVLESGFCDIAEVVSGGARGIDKLGEEWAQLNGKPIKLFPADWTKGKSAGILRNEQMADYADALIAIWDRKSRGTQHMINAMLKRRKPTCILHTPAPENGEAASHETPLDSQDIGAQGGRE